MSEIQKRDALIEIYCIVTRIKAELQPNDSKEVRKAIDTELSVLRLRLKGFDVTSLSEIDEAYLKHANDD